MSVRNAPMPTPIPAITKAMMAYLFKLMPVSFAHTGLPPRNFCRRPTRVKSNRKMHTATKTASTSTLNQITSKGFTTSLGMLMPPSAPPLVVMIWAETALSTDIIATVVTNTGTPNTEANTELASEQPTATAKITSSITAMLPVAL